MSISSRRVQGVFDLHDGCDEIEHFVFEKAATAFDKLRHYMAVAGSRAAEWRGPNLALAQALGRLNWSMRRLVKEIDLFLGVKGSVAVGTVSDWLNKGRTPQGNMPTVVAIVLSDALGEPMSVLDLWSGRAQVSERLMEAHHGMSISEWNVASTLQLGSDWLANTAKGGFVQGIDRRILVMTHGVAGATWGFMTSSTPEIQLEDLQYRAGGIQVTREVVDTIDLHSKLLRNLDGSTGGSDANLALTHSHFTDIARLLRDGRFVDPEVARRLFRAWGECAQTAAWMAFDNGQHGLAQRYSLTALRASHTASDRDLGVAALAFLTYQAVYCNPDRDATDIADTALRASAGASNLVRATVMSRFAYAQAASGHEYAFRKAIEEMREFVEISDHRNPEYLFWFQGGMVDVLAGQGMFLLAQRIERPRERDIFLSQAGSWIGEGLGGDRVYGRDRAVHAVPIARAHALRGELDAALVHARRTSRFLGEVQSPRLARELRKLDADLANPKYRKEPAVVEFRQELGEALNKACV